MSRAAMEVLDELIHWAKIGIETVPRGKTIPSIDYLDQQLRTALQPVEAQTLSPEVRASHEAAIAYYNPQNNEAQIENPAEAGPSKIELREADQSLQGDKTTNPVGSPGCCENDCMGDCGLEE